MMILVALMVLMPFLFWHRTWFGRSLSDQQTEQYLNDAEHPRRTQHALVQIGERLGRGDPGVKRWYPQIVALGGHEKPEVRSTAAWLMGQDNAAGEFHAALGRLLDDFDPLVRQNAALSLVRFGDASGRPVLRQMLLPYPLAAPETGTLEIRLQPDDLLNPGTLLGRVEVGSEEAVEIRSPLPGTVSRWLAADGDRVGADEPVVMLAPDETQVWEALRALSLVGESEDLEMIEPFVRGNPRLGGRIRQQATLTMKAIRERAAARETAPAGSG